MRKGKLQQRAKVHRRKELGQITKTMYGSVCSVYSLVSMLTLFASVFVGVSMPTGQQPDLGLSGTSCVVDLCSTVMPGGCGDHGRCQTIMYRGQCQAECRCFLGWSGVGCDGQDSALPSLPVIHETLQVKVNPIDGLDFGLFGDRLFEPDIFHNLELPQPTTATITTTPTPTTTTIPSTAVPTTVTSTEVKTSLTVEALDSVEVVEVSNVDSSVGVSGLQNNNVTDAVSSLASLTDSSALSGSADTLAPALDSAEVVMSGRNFSNSSSPSGSGVVAEDFLIGRADSRQNSVNGSGSDGVSVLQGEVLASVKTDGDKASSSNAAQSPAVDNAAGSSGGVAQIPSMVEAQALLLSDLNSQKQTTGSSGLAPTGETSRLQSSAEMIEKLRKMYLAGESHSQQPAEQTTAPFSSSSQSAGSDGGSLASTPSSHVSLSSSLSRGSSTSLQDSSSNSAGTGGTRSPP